MKTVLVTGAAGFIGFHLSHLLLEQGFEVIGLDGLTDYYDVQLKRDRLKILAEYKSFEFVHCMLEEYEVLNTLFSERKISTVVHLAAQAGVRYSIEAPRAYIDSNICGTFNVLECARIFGGKHLLIASTSSVYAPTLKCHLKKAIKQIPR